MNSYDPWRQRLPHRDLQPLHPYDSSPWHRLREPTVLLTLVAIALTAVFRLARHAIVFERAAARLWDGVVQAIAFVTPASIIFYFEARVNPSPLPARMLAARYGTHEAKSQAVARLLGADSPAGLLTSVTYVGKRRISNLLAPKRSDKPAGMGNLSYSCYQNSVLQGLASLAPMREYLNDILADRSSGLPRLRITETLATLLDDLYSPQKNGATLWTPPVLTKMSTFQQQDAQEYYSRLLDEVRDEISKALAAARKRPGFEGDGSASDKDETAASQHSEDSGYQSNATSIPRNGAFQIPLEGSMGERVECTVCHQSSGLKVQSFFCLTLNPGFEEPSYDVKDLLNSFVEAERLESVQCNRCTLLKYRNMITKLIASTKDKTGEQAEKSRESWQQRLQPVEQALEDDDSDDETLSEKCQIGAKNRVKSIKTKQVGVTRTPRSLALHINRSHYDAFSGRIAKNNRPVTFPRRLDLGRWCLGSASSRQSNGRDQTESSTAATGTDIGSNSTGGAGDEEEWQLPPQMPMVAGAQQVSRLVGPIYELRAVVTHFGSHESGHYVCYRKHPVSKAEQEAAAKQMKPEAGNPPGPAVEDSDDVADDFQSAQGDNATNGAEGTDDKSTELPVNLEPYWWRLSDQDVARVTEADVMSQRGVFMLFYDCVDPSSVLVTDSASESADSPEVDMGQFRDYIAAREALVAMSTSKAAPNSDPARPGTPVDMEFGDTIEVVGDKVLAATRSAPRPPQPVAEDAGEPAIELAYDGQAKAATRSPLPPPELSVDVADGQELKAAARSDPALHREESAPSEEPAPSQDAP